MCVDDVTHLVAEEGLGNGSGARNFAGAEIGFAFRDDGVLHLGADLHVLHLNGGEDLDDVGAELGGVDDLGRRDGSFEFVDLGFEVGLRFFCRVVFGVFREIAFVAGFSDGCRCSRAVDLLHTAELGDEAVVALLGHVCHVGIFGLACLKNVRWVPRLVGVGILLRGVVGVAIFGIAVVAPIFASAGTSAASAVIASCRGLRVRRFFFR